jgi:DNA processing protein
VSGCQPTRQLPEAAYAAALASLPGAGPAWLSGLLAKYEPPVAWRAVLEGRADPPPRRSRGQREPGRAKLAAAARAFDLARLWAQCERASITVTWLGHPAYPTVLAEGPEPPGVLFWAPGPPPLGEQPAVALIGTRRCSPAGAEVAWHLGYDLAMAGVVVVSGLALGIDGAAHSGALSAAKDMAASEDKTPAPRPARAWPSRPCVTVGVAASGPDVVYPRQHAALWQEVRRHGAIVSETPPGTPAQAWRFPSRNRVIAGLVEMVVVVESHAQGGSWHTVDAALRRGVEVGAVPGPVTSSASAGSNALLHDGALPVRGAEDVLDALGLLGPRVPAWARRAGRGGGRRTAPPGDEAQLVLPSPGCAKDRATGPTRAGPARRGAVEERLLAALGWQPLCLEELVERSGLPPAAVVVGLERLEQEGEVTAMAGWWSRRGRAV